MIKILGYLAVVVVVVIVVAAASLLTQVPRYAKYWRKNNQATAPKNALVYVALGDSTAQSIGATHPDKGYVGLTAKALSQKHGRPVRIVNISKSGAKLEDCLRDQVPELAKLQPDVVTIEIGANDMPSFNEQNFRRDMNSLMAQLPKQTVISNIPYFGGGRRKNLEPNVLAANRVITELARTYILRVAPLYQITKDRDGWQTRALDMFHPSNKGYQNWSDAFWQILQM